MYKEISKCRICGNTNLVSLLLFAEQVLIGAFFNCRNIPIDILVISEKEKEFLNSGRKFIFPLPKIEIVG